MLHHAHALRQLTHVGEEGDNAFALVTWKLFTGPRKQLELFLQHVSRMGGATTT